MARMVRYNGEEGGRGRLFVVPDLMTWGDDEYFQDDWLFSLIKDSEQRMPESPYFNIIWNNNDDDVVMVQWERAFPNAQFPLLFKRSRTRWVEIKMMALIYHTTLCLLRLEDWVLDHHHHVDQSVFFLYFYEKFSSSFSNLLKRELYDMMSLTLLIIPYIKWFTRWQEPFYLTSLKTEPQCRNSLYNKFWWILSLPG